MSAFPRTQNLLNLLKRKSFFLFGPRGTGKSHLIRKQLTNKAVIIDLLKSQLFLTLSEKPSELEPIIKASPQHDLKLVVIDEVQKIPALLNEVHRLIEEQGIRFLLTGSSARKLKRGDANLLAGRAWEAKLLPLTYNEISHFDLLRYLNYGGLPAVYLSDYPEEELTAYVDIYLKEEIQAEALVRKLPSFLRFLKCAALTSGQVMNFSKLASDVGLSQSTITEHYQILEDTFLGFMLPAFTETKKRKPATRGKFYFFDIGVRNALMPSTLNITQSRALGDAFEHFVIMEIRAYLSYTRNRLPLSFWRSERGEYEVDCIIGNEIAIEIKSTEKVNPRHLTGLTAFSEEKICKRSILVSQDPIPRAYGEIQVLHWEGFLKQLWGNQLLAPPSQ